MPYQSHNHRTIVHVLSLLVSLLFLNPSVTAQTPPPTSDNYGSPVPTSAVIVVAVLVGVAIIACYVRQLYACCRAYVFGEADGGGEDDAEVRRRQHGGGLDPAILAAFPTFLYSDIKVHLINKTTPLECAICLSEFVDHEQLRPLPICNHVFHPHCISPWLTSHVTCPVCRANLEIQVDTEKLPELLAEIFRQPSEDASGTSDQNTPPRHDDVVVHVGGSPETRIKTPVVNKNNGRGERTGKFPRSHSTGHSLVEDCERFTLRLPDEVRNKLVNDNNLNVIATSTRVSPRTGYRVRSLSIATISVKPEPWKFIMSPPFISRSGSTEIAESSDNNNNNNNNNLVGIMKSPRSFFKSLKSPNNKSPINRIVRCDDIGERSSDRLWPNNPTSRELELESQ
ncbi:hypothetical protein BVRB_1g008280 [Beta vulgaris subsp. vulgaris]|nr:hypothetical protein BVRB_1g008280 [Beta vulgaris subsp. vulgaris]